MSDDRDYWRRQDERREEFRREYRREDDRRDEQRRLDWEREDREDETRRRDEDHRRAWEEMRRGNTAWALNAIAGPDAAISYLQAMQTPAASEPPADEADPAWPPHVFVTSLAELVTNVASAPAGCRLHAVRIDSDGDALVEARWTPSASLTTLEQYLSTSPSFEAGHFWVRRQLVDEIGDVTSALRRVVNLADAIDELTTGP